MVLFDGAIAIITGAADGMGLQLALQLVNTSDLALIDLSQEKLDAALLQCHQINPNATISTHICDVANKIHTRDLPRAVVKNHTCANRNILLFNNAGIGGGTSLVTSSEEDFDRVFNIDWGGVYNMTRVFLPLMMVAPAAHVINTSSICGFYANIGYLKPNVSYSAAKFAVRGFTLGLLADFKLNAPHIKASCVMPGWIGTGLIDSSQKAVSNSMNTIIAARRSNGLRLRKRIAALQADRDSETVALGELGLLEQLGDIDLTQYSDEQLVQMSSLMGPGFRAMALTSAKDAATIILKGVAKDEWSILVGKDAHALYKLVKEDEALLYEDATVVPDFFDFSTWAMNRGGKKRSRL